MRRGRFCGLGFGPLLRGELGDPSLAFRVPLAVGGGLELAGWDGEDAEQALGAPRGADGFGSFAAWGVEARHLRFGFRWRGGVDCCDSGDADVNPAGQRPISAKIIIDFTPGTS
jgi:hypothetical protein